MPRRVLALLLAAALTLGLCGCAAEPSDYPYYDMEIQIDQLIGQYPVHNSRNLEELAGCDLIVRGKLKGGGEVISDQAGQWTEHFLRITKVYKGDLKKGATIPLRERYAVEKDGSKEKLVLYRDFMPAQVGKEYIFFLDQHDMALVAPSYWTYYDVFERSRYPVISADGLSGDEISSLVDSMSYQDFQLYSAYSEIDLYRELYKAVIQAYMQ